MDFANVLRMVSRHMGSRGGEWAVVGGLALAVHGAGRMTADVDIATQRSEQGALVAYLESLGYETLHVSEGYSNHAHDDPALGRLDVIYVGSSTAGDLFADASVVEIFPTVFAKVPRAEHLVAMKVVAAKNDPDRRIQEMADILALLRATGLAAESVREYFARCDLIDAWEQVRDSL